MTFKVYNVSSMKLSFKIIILITAVILSTLIFDSIITVRREVNLFNKRIEEETLFWGRIIKDSIIEIWESSEQEKALEIINDVNRIEHRNVINWIWLNEKMDTASPLFNNMSKFNMLLNGEEIIIRDFKNGYLHAYIPVLKKDKYGAIEISQSLAEIKKHLGLLVFKTIFLSFTLIVISIVLVWFIGIRLIKNPLDLLAKKTEKISEGNFQETHFLTKHGELYRLELAMNQMSIHLDEARKQRKIETDKRIEALEQLRHSERLAVIGRIASGLAHEIGTPINVIKGRAQLVVSEKLTKKEIMDYSNIIIEETDRITKIIQELLNFAKTGTSKYSLYNINDLLNVVINLLTPTARKSGIDIRLRLLKKQPMVMLDQTKIQQVFINILINAFDAMPDGGTVFIEADDSMIEKNDGTDKKRYAVVKIKDQGLGVNDDIMDKIFDPFFTTKEYGKGTGLGLSIVKNIIDEHNGFIKVEKNNDKGSSFIIYLPCEVNGNG